MKLSELKDGQIVKYRIGRYVEDLPEPKWSQWKTGPLYIHRRTSLPPKAFRTDANNWRIGDIITITIKDDNSEVPAFGQSDFSTKYKCFNCEDWYLEIEGLE